MAANDSALCSSPNDELNSDGFMYKVDAEAGHRVEEMEVNSIPFASEAGLQFYKINVLDDPVCFSIKDPFPLTPPPYLPSYYCLPCIVDANLFQNKRQILNSCFQWFGLGLYRTFGAMPGDYAFRQSDPSSKTESLLIQFWKKGSRVTFWKGSHLEQVPTLKGENNLWRAPRVALTKIGLEPVEVYFEYGGL